MTKYNLSKEFYNVPGLKEFLNELPERVYLYDNDGRHVFMNSSAEKYENHKNDDLIGMHINDLYVQDYSPSLKALETGKKIIKSENIYIVNGRQRIQEAKAIPFYLKDGDVGGVYTIENDLTSINKIITDNLEMQKSSVNDCHKSYSFESILGQDPVLRECIDIAKIAAHSDSPVLLSGYTGSGKEMFARSIHNASSRRNKPFMAVNCAAIPDNLLESILFGTTKGSFTGAIDKKGVFEEAEGGTLFLDELNSMAITSQAKLLRVLEERELTRLGGSKSIATDVRIISSINVSPKEVIEQSQMRTDLFYRLSVISIVIPRLCNRKEDIELITDFFIKKYGSKFGKKVTGIDEEVHDFFISYQWPGNVRQLKYVIESTINLMNSSEKIITMRNLPHYLHEEINNQVKKISANVGETLRDTEIKDKKQIPLFTEDLTNENQDIHIETNTDDVFEMIKKREKERIIDALVSNNGNISKSSRELGMHRQSLINKMKKYGIKK